MGAMPFAANLARVRAQLRANRTKMRKIRQNLHPGHATPKKSLSSPDSPQFFIHKVHFKSQQLTARSHFLMPNTNGGEGRVIGLGVCCILLEGGRPNAAVKPRYFLPHPSYVCRQETKPPNNVFSPKRLSIFIFTSKGFRWDGKTENSILSYIFCSGYCRPKQMQQPMNKTMNKMKM